MRPAWRLWWLPGIACVCVLVLVALALEAGRVHQDLAARVTAQLAADGQGWATGEVSGRIVTVMGTAPTLIAQSLAVQSAQRVWGVASVVDGSGVLPLQVPYAWSAERDGDAIVLKGYAPSEDVRLSVGAAVARILPGFRVEDHMQLARGQPGGFLAYIDFALNQLAALSGGKVALVDGEFSIDGVAADDRAFADLAQALHGPTAGDMTIRAVRVMPPYRQDFLWRAEFDAASVKITGAVPSDSLRADITNGIRSVMPGTTIDDQATLASGSPEGFISAVLFALAQAAHLDHGVIQLTQGQLSIQGKAKSISDYDAVVQEVAARKTPPGRGVAIGKVTIEPAFVDPYVWEAERQDGAVRLSGYMPTETAKANMLAAARRLMSGVEIRDETKIADGDPKMDWIGAVGFALGQLAQLDKGKVSLAGRQYDIAGEALSATAYTNLTEALKKTLPASMELNDATISPMAVSPFILSVARIPDALSFSGYVPTNDAAKAIVSAAQPKFPSDRMDVRLLLAGGAPPKIADAISAGMLALSRLDGGRLDLVDRKLQLSGLAVTDAAKAEIEAQFRSELPDGFDLSSSVTVAAGGDPLPGPDCQVALHAETDREAVQFDGNGSDISENSFGLIDRIAAVLQRCPAATIEIGSHLDSSLGPKRSQALSDARANAVADRLAADGVRRERLSAVGYGNSRPIASNSTAAGRLQNRRIEFNVVGL